MFYLNQLVHKYTRCDFNNILTYRQLVNIANISDKHYHFVSYFHFSLFSCHALFPYILPWSWMSCTIPIHFTMELDVLHYSHTFYHGAGCHALFPYILPRSWMSCTIPIHFTMELDML